MNQQDKQIRSLTWKYFWKQKWAETDSIRLFLGGVWYFIGGIVVLANLGFYFDTRSDTFLQTWMWVVYLISVIIPLSVIFIRWIKDNWEVASEKATRELVTGEVATEDELEEFLE